jgi:hypothetical protein
MTGSEISDKTAPRVRGAGQKEHKNFKQKKKQKIKKTTNQHAQSPNIFDQNSFIVEKTHQTTFRVSY